MESTSQRLTSEVDVEVGVGVWVPLGVGFAAGCTSAAVSTISGVGALQPVSAETDRAVKSATVAAAVRFDINERYRATGCDARGRSGRSGRSAEA
ncbi:hypothetical protein ASF63_17620 [Microbacterium sp. Leaf320]|nr:hypothetical protein ASF63_17620 [Microbacterium sp. Leaf320]